MSEQRFWVIGGEFSSSTFDELNTETARVIGPFADRTAAEKAWRDLSRRHGHEFNTRFAVVHEPLKVAAA